MNSVVDIECILYNNKQKFRDQEYIDLMKKLQSLCKMLETKICSNPCDEKHEEETECPYCGGTWYKSDYE